MQQMVATTLLLFPHLFGVVVLVLGKLQTSNVIVFFIRIYFSMTADSDAKNVCLSTGGKKEGHQRSIWNAASKIPYPVIGLSSEGTSRDEDIYQDVCHSSQSCHRLRTSEWSQF
jgi:hypothetical protein